MQIQHEMLIDSFDTSNYDPADNRPLPKGRNKKVMGKMKGELGGAIITHFIALRSKCYAYITDDGMSTKKCKGVKCPIVKGMSFKEFERSLLLGNQIYKEHLTFRTTNHTITTQKKMIKESQDLIIFRLSLKVIKTLDRMNTLV